MKCEIKIIENEGVILIGEIELKKINDHKKEIRSNWICNPENIYDRLEMDEICRFLMCSSESFEKYVEQAIGKMILVELGDVFKDLVMVEQD